MYSCAVCFYGLCSSVFVDLRDLIQLKNEWTNIACTYQLYDIGFWPYMITARGREKTPRRRAIINGWRIWLSIWTQIGRHPVCVIRRFRRSYADVERQARISAVRKNNAALQPPLFRFLPRCSMQGGPSHRNGVCPSICLSVCLSVTAWIVTKRKHLAKKVQLWLIGSRLLRFQWA